MNVKRLSLHRAIGRLKQAYERFSGKTFDKTLFLQAFEERTTEPQPYIGVMGVRVSGVLEQMIQDNIRMRVDNLTCTGGRKLILLPEELSDMEEDVMFLAYAEALLGQLPCFLHEQQHKKKSVVSGPEPERHYLSYHQVL